MRGYIKACVNTFHSFLEHLSWIPLAGSFLTGSNVHFQSFRTRIESLSEGLEISEEEVRERIGVLKQNRVIRQISAIFNTGALGYRSSLVAMAVPQEALERAAQIVNAYPGVSHNYLRPGSFNMWFTIAVPPGQSLEAVSFRTFRQSGRFARTGSACCQKI